MAGAGKGRQGLDAGGGNRSAAAGGGGAWGWYGSGANLFLDKTPAASGGQADTEMARLDKSISTLEAFGDPSFSAELELLRGRCGALVAERRAGKPLSQ